MTTVSLAGCRLEPLGSYLKALGILRLVAMQVDVGASGWWEGETFRLDSSLDEEGLVDFFLTRYAPTPVLSPWNSDAGFKESTSSEATRRLRRMEATTDPRLGPFRRSIGAVREIRSTDAWAAADKVEQVTMLRNELDDDALEWIDAAIVLRSEKPAFPALLGAGGNFGRLELSPTFMARLLEVLDGENSHVERSRAWVHAALYDSGAPRLTGEPIGQFDPGGAGGLRADARAGKPITNPWDFVLTIEGSLVWTSGVARRDGSMTSLATVPFTVMPSAVGDGSLAAGERAKSELWAPYWGSPLSLPAVRRLFNEGRISWSRGQARSGLDALRALRTLGVDAGLTGFVRYLVAERMGQSPLAIPLGQFPVESRADERVAVLASIDAWADKLRRSASGDKASASQREAVRAVDAAMFVATSGTANDVQEVLISLAQAESNVGRTERARRENVLRPVHPLAPDEWLSVLDDGSAELRLAAALAVAVDSGVSSARAGSLRTLLRPLAPVPSRRDRFAGVEWTSEEAPVPGFGVRPVVEVLADALIARSEMESVGPGGGVPRERSRGEAEPWFDARLWPGARDSELLAGGGIDVERFGRLLSGLLLLAPRPQAVRLQWRVGDDQIPEPVPAWRILVPFFAGIRIDLGSGPLPLRPAPTWARRLASGNIAGVLADALVRWQEAGVATVYDRRRVDLIASGVDGHLLAASLLCGATRRDVNRAYDDVVRGRDERSRTALSDETPPEGVRT